MRDVTFSYFSRIFTKYTAASSLGYSENVAKSNVVIPLYIVGKKPLDIGTSSLVTASERVGITVLPCTPGRNMTCRGPKLSKA